MVRIRDDFETIRAQAKQYYASLRPVYCPYFKEHISFTAGGIEHLLFKRRGVVRPAQDQYMRCKLLALAPIVIQESGTVQGVLHTTEHRRFRRRGKKEIHTQQVSYYEFIAVIGHERVKIIVKRLGKEGLYFWSIIPFWKKGSRDTPRKLHTGNIYED